MLNLLRRENNFVYTLTVDRHLTKNSGFNISAVLMAKETPFSGILGKEFKTTLRAIYAGIFEYILLQISVPSIL